MLQIGMCDLETKFFGYHHIDTFIRDTLFTAKMARDILWDKEKSIKLEDFVTVSQT